MSLRRSRRCLSKRDVLSETVELVHPFMQHRRDPDRAIGQQAPIDVMMLIAAVEAIDPELDRYRAPGNLSFGNFAEPSEHAPNVAGRLIGAPAVPRINVYFIEATARPIQNAKCGHAISSARYAR